MSIPLGKSLLTLRKAAEAWLLSLVLYGLLFLIAPKRHFESVHILFATGHLLLGMKLVVGKLKVSWPPNSSWFDLIVVCGIPYWGPIFWYRAWRKQILAQSSGSL